MIYLFTSEFNSTSVLEKSIFCQEYRLYLKVLCFIGNSFFVLARSIIRFSGSRGPGSQNNYYSASPTTPFVPTPNYGTGSQGGTGPIGEPSSSAAPESQDGASGLNEGNGNSGYGSSGSGQIAESGADIGYGFSGGFTGSSAQGGSNGGGSKIGSTRNGYTGGNSGSSSSGNTRAESSYTEGEGPDSQSNFGLNELVSVEENKADGSSYSHINQLEKGDWRGPSNGKFGLEESNSIPVSPVGSGKSGYDDSEVESSEAISQGIYSLLEKRKEALPSTHRNGNGYAPSSGSSAVSLNSVFFVLTY